MSLITTGGGNPTFNYNVDAITGGTTGKVLTLANMATQWGVTGNTTDTFNVTGGVGSGYTVALGSGASGTGVMNIYNPATINSNTAGGALVKSRGG